jgi:monothiol glutaredoxin
MGIRNRVKKLVLPLIGRGSGKQDAAPGKPAPRPVARPVYEEPKSPRGEVEPRAWIEQQIKEHPVVLFMKGSPEQPQCGFSANAAGILRGTGKPLHHVDVLLDPEVREMVKEVSSWPTIPQIYVGGEFLGGADILTEMSANGELAEALAEAFPAAE